ncbi:DUF547 domain-containing protein [Nisaea acidiphila]|uniref:DUF547 domain-containing protein n=1 Tax=Nisaea acidiphila TaxID=1862145 RepID=A0A9J7AV92_9PROT|nr:DUF547 domain-containing protein [Nisaea acidiphila]UUX51030.1 DUF547 domain-containing protein [Nisaea acidiphila]
MSLGCRIAASLIAVTAFATSAFAAPKAELWGRWEAHAPGGAVTLTHSAWDMFLTRYVRGGTDGIARVDYGAVTETDRAALYDYVTSLEAIPVTSLSRSEQLPYWVNLYNALTVRVVLEHYPVDSIRDIDISPGLFADGPWGKKLATVEGEEISLDDIEHRILRPVWRDPRIHYAVNCASLGCPNLQPRAMTAANAERYLEHGASAYINHPRGARVESGKLIVSSIYDWFDEDFGGDDAGVIAHLKRYATGTLADALRSVGRISDDEYDWRLNDVAK